MTGTQSGAWKGYAITFGLTLVATIVGGMILDKLIRSSEEKALAAQNKAAALQQPRKVATTTSEEPITTA